MKHSTRVPRGTAAEELERLVADHARITAQRDELATEVDGLRRLVTTWEMTALAGLLALGLDAGTAERVSDHIRELSTPAGSA